MVVADLEAGVGTLQRMLPGQADYALVVAQPTAKSIEAARRAIVLAGPKTSILLVANRVRSDADLQLIADGVGADAELFAVPDDPAVAAADEDGSAPFDVAPDAPAVRAVARLADRLAGAVP